jgi:hypothetical protein
VSFDGVESAVPSIVDVEDRHVEHKHWIVHSAATKYFSPSGCETSSIAVDFSFSSSFVLLELGSVVEQKQGEKAGQNPEHWAENSEPECDIPACAREECDFARACFCESCHEIYSSMVRFSF